MSELLFRPVHELAALVRAGEISASELVGASLERIDALDGQLNAFTHVDADGALATAAAIGPDDPRPFAGVPIAIKDNRPVAGMPITLGSRLLGGLTPPFDAVLVQRLRRAGFVIVGKTALPEFGILPTTESALHGPTRNPWDLTRTPGGSSGGAAAAVAAGMVPIAHGNDGGGSLRIPAACCGLVGLKPSRGRVTLSPTEGESFLVTDGVLTRTVGETAALLDVLAGPAPGDASWAPAPPEPFAQTAARAPGPLRIGFCLTPPLETTAIDPLATQAVHDTVALLGELGHTVEEIDPPWALPGLLELFGAAFGPAVASSILFASTIAGHAPREEDVEPLSWWLWEQAQGLDAAHYLAAIGQLQALSRTLVTATAAYDAVLTPALAQRPVELGTLNGETSDPAATFRGGGEFTPFTPIANVTGQPAISIPLFHGDDGLPTGVHFFGRPAQEGPLLALAAQLEAARPWTGRRPELVAAA
ncbi:amidase [Conexibacter sp. CPCC 206217]|uniref:amidase n=1 Tax=Conexibacter sp. CPCC 206217 TaxID=3064574 RepID=UPI002718D2AB|nr:amidase [Conexibacter sp. CPCC 206217]MDO8213718.1 amidase [Conexibacter sp. CPCC 206217]